MVKNFCRVRHGQPYRISCRPPCASRSKHVRPDFAGMAMVRGKPLRANDIPLALPYAKRPVGGTITL